MSQAAWDEAHMRAAIAAARKGYDASPNPRVGAVIARGAEALAIGFHARAGAPHGEADAIARAKENGVDTRGATLYVTLEPCNHHGRTPPCTDAVVAAGFARVVIACRDTAPHVPGAEAKLRAAGIEVEYGLLEEEAAELVVSFFKHLATGLPYVTLKAAVTLDGRMASRTGDSKWISGESSRREAHRLRAEADAILVGVDTVLADDPRLDVRLVEGRSPVRVVLDTQLRTPPDAAMLSLSGPTWVLHGPAAAGDRRSALRDAGATLFEIPFDGAGQHLSMQHAMKLLGQRDIVRLLVEGGGRVHGALLDQGLADAAVLFIAPRIVGDTRAIGFAAGRGADTISGGWQIESPVYTQLDRDIMLTGRLVRSE